MQLSILLPSLRPSQIDGCLESIHAAADGLDYEILVIGDPRIFPDGVPEHVAFVPELEHRGPIPAILAGAAEAKGDYLFVLSDENRLSPLTLTKLYQRAELTRSLGKRAIHCPWFRTRPSWRYYGRVFPPFPFIHKDIAKNLGGLFDPAYRAHYADPDLGMRASEAGVEIRLHDDLGITHKNPHDDLHHHNHAAYFAQDEQTFRARWAHLKSPTCTPEFEYA